MKCKLCVSVLYPGIVGKKCKEGRMDCMRNRTNTSWIPCGSAVAEDSVTQNCFLSSFPRQFSHFYKLLPHIVTYTVLKLCGRHSYSSSFLPFFSTWKLIMQEMINHSGCLSASDSMFKREGLQAAQNGWPDTNHALALTLVVHTVHPTIKVTFLLSICNAPEMISEIPN